MPILLSTLDSTLFWKSCGVVVDEKFEFITTCSSDLYFLKNELMRVVFAEPCSPISRRFLVDKSRFHVLLSEKTLILFAIHEEDIE